MRRMVNVDQIDDLNEAQLRALSRQLASQLNAQSVTLQHTAQSLDQTHQAIAELQREVVFKTARIDKLTHELAHYRRIRFERTSEKRDAAQISLLEEEFDADLTAIETELEQLSSPRKGERQVPRRENLPAHLPRVEIQHEPESTLCHCGCALKRIGEDVAEKLAYAPGVFTVERHVRGKWVCQACKTLTQAPVPPQVIDKSFATAGLLAQVMVAKYADHMPLYRQEGIFARAGFAIPRSTLGEWVGTCGVQLQPLVDALKQAILGRDVLHADETPVAMLKPGNGKTHRAYLWTYAPGAFDDLRAVVYEFAESRSGKNAQEFLGEWVGRLVCDDYAGYKALWSKGIVECGCLAHARRKFYQLQESSKSPVAEKALEFFAQLYAVEAKVGDLDAGTRREVRQAEARPIADALHAWMVAQRLKVPDGGATAKALDYSLKRWAALTRYLDDSELPPDNNYIENRIRPVAVGRSNWLFVGSLRAGQRAAAIMSLIQSAKLNGHDPYAYLKDIFTRLPTHPASRVTELLPHNWQPSSS